MLLSFNDICITQIIHDQNNLPGQETFHKKGWNTGVGFLHNSETMDNTYSGRMGEAKFFILFNSFYQLSNKI